MKKQFNMTKEGVTELEKERDAIIANRSAIIERIKLAREFGDLSENAEYSSARQEQNIAESRFGEIEHILKNVQIITQPKVDGVVELGNTVVLKNLKGKKTFTIVGSVEADPLNGKVSDESPIGKILIGKKVNSEIEIATPAETATYKIVKVS